MKAPKAKAMKAPKAKAKKAPKAKAKAAVKKEVKTDVQAAGVAASAKKWIPHYRSRADAKMPKVGDGPIDYKHGRIYTSSSKSVFRVICQRGDYFTERNEGCKWKNKDKPDKKVFENRD